MADVNISKYRASVVRDGSKPATQGFVVSEGQDPVDPPGNAQNHLPVTINATATALSITESQILSGAGTVANTSEAMVLWLIFQRLAVAVLQLATI